MGACRDIAKRLRDDRATARGGKIGTVAGAAWLSTAFVWLACNRNSNLASSVTTTTASLQRACKRCKNLHCIQCSCSWLHPLFLLIALALVWPAQLYICLQVRRLASTRLPFRWGGCGVGASALKAFKHHGVSYESVPRACRAFVDMLQTVLLVC